MSDSESDYQSLRRISAVVGANFDHIQAAGGNSSIKLKDKMLIKASGKMMAKALTEDIFVEVPLSELIAAFDAPKVYSTKNFVNEIGLRPSIETLVHAVLPWKFVLHTHSLHTNRYLCIREGKALLTSILNDLSWVWIKYRKPGIDLAIELKRNHRNSQIILLENHGLLLCGNSAVEIENLLKVVTQRLHFEKPASLSKDTRSISLPFLFITAS